MRLTSTSRVIAAAAALVFTLGVAGCGSETEPTASDPEPTGSSATEEPSDAPEDQPGSLTRPPVDDADLPGDPMDQMPPLAGDELAVVGVEIGDVLNVRALPDPAAETLGEGLEPVATGLVASGRNRLVDSGIWAELDLDGSFGWANTSYLAYLGESEDRTADLGEVGGHDSTKQLAGAVAAALGDGKAVVIAETGSELVVDALVAEDDSRRGDRLTITVAVADGTYTAESVAVAPLCARGVSGDNLCL